MRPTTHTDLRPTAREVAKPHLTDMPFFVSLDRRTNLYTNFDLVQGRIIIELPKEEFFTGIVAKLECESRTRLAIPKGDGRRDGYDTELEVHKLLYKTMTVFPSAQAIKAAPRGASFMISAGKHEFPFQFQIPSHNDCAPTNSLIDRIEMANIMDNDHHVKRPLPPSVSGFPGEAEIRYFIKATGQRAAFYKENYRHEFDFRFLPIEPLRSPANRRESFARRQHQFAPPSQFSRGTSSGKYAPFVSPLPIIIVDGRLPDPAVITCNKPLPLRVLIRKLNECNGMIHLRLFQISLVGYTRIRARELERSEMSSWVITSHSNLFKPLGPPGMPAQKEIELDSSMWSQVPLSDSVVPSFETCNITRIYELEISIGLTYEFTSSLQTELTIQRLRMPVQVYSGMVPTTAQLNGATERQKIVEIAPAKLFGRAELKADALSSSDQAPSTKAGIQSAPYPVNHTTPEVPPPSYEDAIAEDLNLTPVDGPRREHEQASMQVSSSDMNDRDGRVNGDRLFPP